MGLFGLGLRQEEATERQVQALIDLLCLPGYTIDRFSSCLSGSTDDRLVTFQTQLKRNEDLKQRMDLPAGFLRRYT